MSKLPPSNIAVPGYQCLLHVMVENWSTGMDGKRVQRPDWGPIWVHAEYVAGDREVGEQEGWIEYGADGIDHERIVGWAPLPEMRK